MKARLPQQSCKRSSQYSPAHMKRCPQMDCPSIPAPGHRGQQKRAANKYVRSSCRIRGRERRRVFGARPRNALDCRRLRGHKARRQQVRSDASKREWLARDDNLAARRARGEHPGIVKRIETSIELEMLQLEQLWRNLGLPV